MNRGDDDVCDASCGIEGGEDGDISVVSVLGLMVKDDSLVFFMLSHGFATLDEHCVFGDTELLMNVRLQRGVGGVEFS